MNLFSWFSKKPKDKTVKVKEFTFEVLEAVKVGDKHKYTVQAKTEKEAFIKLVKYFYGEDCNQEVKSEHYDVTYPISSTFETNMPYWFAKRISGYRKDNGKDYQMKLEKFALDNGIKLKT